MDALSYFLPPTTAEGTLLEAMMKIGAHYASKAVAVFTYAQIATATLEFLDGLQAEAIAQTLDSPGESPHDKLRRNLDALRDNARKIENTDNLTKKQEYYQERKKLLERTYPLLPKQVNEVYSQTEGSQIYSFIGIPGTSLNIGRTSYSSIRGSTASLRLVLIMDYRATVAWLNNESTSVHLARNTVDGKVVMPTHRLDYSKKTARAYDSLDVPDDYAVYKIHVSKDQVQLDRELRVRVRSVDMENFTAYIKRTPFENYKNPQGTRLTTSNGDKRAAITDLQAGDYYLLVKTENQSLPYRATATVYEPDGLPIIGWHRIAPEMQVTERGFGKLTDADIPDKPKPDVQTICTLPTDSGYRVSVTGDNNGATSKWQSLAVGLKGITNKDNVTIVRSSVGTPKKYRQAWGSYGTEQYNLSYVLVEGAVTDWVNKQRSLVVRVDPPTNDTYTVYVKSVARTDGGWRSDPAIGEVQTVDGQNEYVYTRNVTVADIGGTPSTSWKSPQVTQTRTGVNPAVDGPTASVTESWSTEVGTVVGSPIVVGDRAFVTTKQEVFAVNRSTGAIIWNETVSSGITAGPAFRNGVLYVPSNGKILLLNAASGESGCSFQVNGRVVGAPVFKDGDLFVATNVRDPYYQNELRVYSLDAITGTVQWSKWFTDKGAGEGITVQGETVYAVGRKGTIYALDRLTGRHRWTKSVQGHIAAPIAARDGAIYVGTTTGHVVAFRADGMRRWEYHVGGRIDDPMAVGTTGLYLASGDRLVSLRRSDGTWRWSSQIGGKVSTGVAVTDSGVFVGSATDQRIYSLDPEDGHIRWKQYTSTVQSHLAVIRDNLYVASGGSLREFTGQNGAPTVTFEWSPDDVSVGTDVTFTAAGTDLDENTTYSWSVDGNTSVGDSSSITVQFETAGEHFVTLSASGPNGTATETKRIMVSGERRVTWQGVSGDQMHQAVTDRHAPSHNLTQQWSQSLSSATTSAPTVMNGTIYVATKGGQVLAVDQDDSTVRWQTELPGSLTSPVLSERLAFVSSSKGTVYALNRSTGAVVWKHDAQLTWVSQPVVAGGTVYFTGWIHDIYTSNDGSVYAVDAETGVREWQQYFNNQPISSRPVVYKQSLLVATVEKHSSGGRVKSFDLNTGSTEWTTAFSGRITTTPTVRGDTAYLAFRSGRVVALSLIRGETVWWSYESGISSIQSAAVTESRVYVAGNHRIAVLNRTTGKWIWTASSRDTFTSGPIVTADSVLVASAADNRVYAYDRTDGSQRWVHRTDSVRTAPVVGDSTVYYGTKTELIALHGDSGAPQAAIEISSKDGRNYTLRGANEATRYEWDLDGDGSYELAGRKIAHDFERAGAKRITLRVTNESGSSDTTTRRIVVGDAHSQDTSAVSDAATSAVTVSGPTHELTSRWLESISGKLTSAPTMDNGTVYASTTSGTVYAFSRDGTRRWRTTVAGSASAPVLGNDVLVVTTNKGHIYALDKSSGEIRWSASISGHAYQARVDDGTVYVASWSPDIYGSNDGHVAAFDVGTGDRLWQRTLGNTPVTGPIAIDQTKVYVPSTTSNQNSRIYALDKLTGSTFWRQTFSTWGAGTGVAVDGEVVVASLSSGDVATLSTVDGTVKWKESITASRLSAPAVTTDRIFVAWGRRVVAINRTGRNVAWTFKSTYGGITTRPVVSNTSVFVASKSGQRIYGLDVLDGSKRWSYPSYRVQSTPLVTQSALYIGVGSQLLALEGEPNGPSVVIDVQPNPDIDAPVRLSATRSIAYSGSFTSYKWDTDGDGTFAQSGETIDYNYTTPGVKTVTLRVSDASGRTFTEQVTFRIPDETAPKVALQQNRTIVPTGTTVGFDATGTTDNLGVTTFEWAFDGGQFVTGDARMAHTFTEAGTHTVTVRATDRDGNNATVQTTVTVVSEYSSNLSATRTIHDAPQPGETANVTVQITANETVSGPALTVDLPEGYQIISQNSTGTFKPNRTRWLWNQIDAGETINVTYEVQVPTNASVGDTPRIFGSVNGYAQTPVAVAGDKYINISTCVDRVAAGPDGMLTLAEIQRVLHWWQTSSTVPNTGGEVIGLTRAQALVTAWQTNSTIGCSESGSLQSVQSTTSFDTSSGPTVTVDAPKRVAINDTFTLSTTIETNAFAPAIAPVLPDGFSVVSVDTNGTVHSNTSEILWLENGSQTATYTIRVGENVSTGNQTLRTAGSSLSADGDHSITAVSTTVNVTDALPPALSVMRISRGNQVGSETMLTLNVTDRDGNVSRVYLARPSGERVAATQTDKGKWRISFTANESTWSDAADSYVNRTYTVVAEDGDNVTTVRTVEIMIYIEGDVTGDGIVDIFDAVSIGRAWGTTREDAGYSAIADVNNDGSVNIFDAVLVGKNWMDQAGG